MFAEHGSTTSSLSSDGETEPQDVETEEEDIMMEAPIRLKRDFGGTSLDRYPSTDCLLNELLGDIRRSRTTSLASTPTNISSDYETENVFDMKNRSEAELRKLGNDELRGMVDTLEQEAECVSTLLVKLLYVRDKRVSRLTKQFGKLTTILRDYAGRNGLNSDLEFSLHVPLSEGDYQKVACLKGFSSTCAQWENAWKVLSRLPKGIPKHWRKTLWLNLAERSTTAVDWSAILHSTFNEFSTPEDDSLGAQIVKDLHRTGNTGFTTEEEHGILKRVLLAYARFNKSIGYCQGFNILAALILKVVNFNEQLALKVMVFLVDFVLPENYFAQNLYALSADMAVFRELLRYYLPELNAHIEELQRGASGAIKKSYSSENPPDQHSIHAYEPPLADVFTMQWFLTIFATSLPRKATRRVWDAIFLEGSEVLLYTATAILAVMEKELLQTATAADFYAVMAQFGERLRRAQLLPSTEFMQIVYAIQDCASMPDSTIPNIKKLREKYTYNIYPCGLLEPETEGDTADGGGKDTIMCPPPSRGGSFFWRPREKKDLEKKREEEEEGSHKPGKVLRDFVVKETLVDEVEGGESGRCLEEFPIETQVKLLKEHYAQVARQPTRIKCNISLSAPRARAQCPQMKRAIDPSPGIVAYAADVPLDVVHQSRILGGSNTLQFLHQQRNKSFTICYSQPVGDPRLDGFDLVASPQQQDLSYNGHEDFTGSYGRQGKPRRRSTQLRH